MTAAENKVPCAVVERKEKGTFELITYTTHKSVAWKSASAMNGKPLYKAGQEQFEVVLRDDWDAGKTKFLPAPKDFDYEMLTEETLAKASVAPRPEFPKKPEFLKQETTAVTSSVTQKPVTSSVTKPVSVTQSVTQKPVTRTETVLNVIGSQPVTAVDISGLCGLPLNNVLAELLVLIHKKQVTKQPDKTYVRIP